LGGLKNKLAKYLKNI